MRVPKIINANVSTAYFPSDVSLHLKYEKRRKIHPEDFEWDEGDNFIPTLAHLSLRVIASNFDRTYAIIHDLGVRDQNHLNEIISIELDLEKVVKNVDSDVYWQRRYQAHFSIVPLQPHMGWTWKCLYLEQHFRRLLENAEPEYRDEERFEQLLKLCHPYIHTLTITQLRQWKPPKTLLLSELPDVDPVYHISFIPILKHLTDLSQLEICYGLHDVGANYEKRMFELDVCDCENLGEAVSQLKHLKILRLHKSEVGCKHVQGLVKKLIRNTSLIELNLSHCKIGTLGAKCIGNFLLHHERLKILRLKNNKIGPEGMLGLGWSLIQPQGARVKVLDLSMNPLGKGGCMNLMRTLIRSTVPRDLSIAHCNFDGPIATMIPMMLAVNKSLQRMDISGNAFGPDGGQRLLEAVENNERLREIDMRETDIPEETQKEIKRLLKRNWVSAPAKKSSSFNVLFLDLLNKMSRMDADKESQLLELISDNPTESELSLRNYYLGPGLFSAFSMDSSIKTRSETHGTETFLKHVSFMEKGRY